MIKLRRLRCSFCRKNENEVSKLVAGPRVYICDECVAIAGRMMESDSDDTGRPAESGQTIWRRLSARARRWWRGHDAQRTGSLNAQV